MMLILKPISLGLGGLFLFLALIHFLSATLGRGRWLRPVANIVGRIIEWIENFLEGWSKGTTGFTSDLSSDILKALSLLQKPEHGAQGNRSKPHTLTGVWRTPKPG